MNYWRYTKVYVTTFVLVNTVSATVHVFLDYDLSAYLTDILPPVIAAMMEGQVFVRREGRMPSRNEGWRFARMATLISLIVWIAINLVFLAFKPETRAALIQLPGPAVLLVIFRMIAIWSVAVLIVSRWMLWVGARIEVSARKAPA